MPEEKKRVGAGFGVMVVRAGAVLLGKRNDDKEKASSELSGEGTWTMPGGKFEFGESFEEGAARELEEETGLILKKMRVLCVQNDMTEKAHFVTIGFLAKEYKGEVHVMEPEEITEWRWFPIDKVPQNLFPPSAKVLEAYKRQTFYVEP